MVHKCIDSMKNALYFRMPSMLACLLCQSTSCIRTPSILVCPHRKQQKCKKHDKLPLQMLLEGISVQHQKVSLSAGLLEYIASHSSLELDPFDCWKVDCDISSVISTHPFFPHNDSLLQRTV